MRRSFLALAATIALSLGTGRPAIAQRDQMVVNTAWLAKHLKDPNLVLLHVGERRASTTRMHIPGARFVELDDISVSEPRQQRSDARDADRRHRCATGSQRSASPTTRASSSTTATTGSRRRRASSSRSTTRGSARSTALLDGGMPAWIARRRHGHRRRAPPQRAGTARARSRIKPIVVDAAYVKAHIGNAGRLASSTAAPRRSTTASRGWTRWRGNGRTHRRREERSLHRDHRRQRST